MQKVKKPEIGEAATFAAIPLGTEGTLMLQEPSKEIREENKEKKKRKNKLEIAQDELVEWIAECN